MKIIILLFTVLLLTSSNSFAGLDNSMENKDREIDQAIPRQIINVLDQFTVGAIQTIAGASAYTFLLMFDTKTKMVSHGGRVQVRAINDIFKSTGYISLGLFQIGPSDEYDVGHISDKGIDVSIVDHEVGHTEASTSLGPMYLPLIGLSYLTAGFDQGVYESWATEEGSNTKTYIYGNVTTTLSYYNKNGVSMPMLAIKVSLTETETLLLMQNHATMERAHHWLNLTLKKFNTIDNPYALEVNLLEKTVHLRENKKDQTEVSTDSDYGLDLNTTQKYLSAEKDSLLGLLKLDYLFWQLNIGGNYKTENGIELSADAGANVRLSQTIMLEKTKAYTQKTNNFGVRGGLEANARLNYKQLFEVLAQVKRDYFPGKIKQNSFSLQLLTGYPFNQSKKLKNKKIQFQLGYQYQTTEGPLRRDNTQEYSFKVLIPKL